MSWSYWIFCTVITVLVGFIAVATAINLHCSFAFELLIIAVFICIPFRSIPIVKDEKKVNESYVLDIPYEKGNYVKISNREDTRYINFIKNGEDETLKIGKDCKIRYKIGKQNKISYKRSSKTNIFGTVYYDKISDVLITKGK
ncbi:hypothetical protein DXA62_12785 [Coprobacillus sp. OF03-2AA]|nr:hypothetical protein DXA62_12785 [Coprobacillus sp. OF03-2AA]